MVKCEVRGARCDVSKVRGTLRGIWAHDDLRILCDFTFYVPHSTSDDVSSLFVMFFARTIRYF